MALFMNRLSTHVLDTAQGKPAKDVPVRLERQESGGEWRLIFSSRTDGDGRCPQLLPENETLRAGNYRLAFDTASYHLAQNAQGLYPVVDISRARRRIALPHSTALESARLHYVPGKLT
jgi:5-hydroxyisourate hydrolase